MDATLIYHLLFYIICLSLFLHFPSVQVYILIICVVYTYELSRNLQLDIDNETFISEHGDLSNLPYTSMSMTPQGSQHPLLYETRPTVPIVKNSMFYFNKMFSHPSCCLGNKTGTLSSAYNTSTGCVCWKLPKLEKLNGSRLLRQNNKIAPSS